MFTELQQRSILEKKPIRHTNISFVYFRGKECFCLKHPELIHLNRGAMRQHIQGKKHRLDFDTGEPLVKTENRPADIEEHAKEWANQKSTKKAENDPFIQLAMRLCLIFLIQDPVVAFLLAKYGIEDKELRDEVIMCLRFRTNYRAWEEANKAK